ncbi:unnamed protein product [Owenia fusiformis]|uniref:Uncharacterized protein n=1 Tax=Owenia fusiformis TaxID=6347 RepID=A0A8J1UUZ2_OWEFU|nr:unnamed protein product [Owenia fusiformis]
MLPLIIVLACAFSSGLAVDIPDPGLCLDAFGYLPGVDFGEDCCSFVMCDAARLNKSGVVGQCMGGTVWNQDLTLCDDPKFVPDCDPKSCTVVKRTNAPCSDPQPSDTTCCIGQKPDQGFFGYEPVYTADGPNAYFKGDDRQSQTCPDSQLFNLDTCSCEYEFEPIAECAGEGEYFMNDDPSTANFPVPANSDLELDQINPTEAECCSYLQCYPNRTGFYVQQCMPSTVWNDEKKACDLPQNVMPCMNMLCGAEMTDPPCNGDGDGLCCRAGLWYDVGADATQYIISDAPGLTGAEYNRIVNGRSLMCPRDMNGLQLVFNPDPDSCSCE